MEQRHGTPPAEAHDDTYDAGPFARQFVLRTAGLPIESVYGLRCPHAARWAEDMLREDERLRQEGERLGDLLHDVIGGSDDEALRRRLLKLRRDLFNNRLPAQVDDTVRLLAAAAPAVAEDVDGWVGAHRAWAARRTQGAELLAEESGHARARLRALAEDERLRRGVLLASPSLDAQLDGYLRAPVGPPDKRRRKIERSLVSYLYRTACKTSPFSTFTGVGLGSFDTPDADAAPDASEPGHGLHARVADDWTSHPRLNVLALDRLAEAVLADPARRADLPVALAPGWGRDEDRVRYVRRWVTAGDDDTAVTFDSVKDRLFFLRRSGTLERLLALFEDRTEIRYGALSDWLRADRDADAEECARYLDALVDVGMLQVPRLRTGVHDTDPLAAFRRSLRLLERPWADELADRLGEPADCIREFATASSARRRVLLDRLRASLRTIQEELGVDSPRVPQTVLYEDVAAGERVAMDARAWSEAAEQPLRNIERLLPAFDLTLPQRLTFKGFFLARYRQGGRCDDLLKLVHDFHEDFFDQYLSFTSRRTAIDADGNYVPEENWLGLPQLKSLDSARQLFIERMRALWAERESDGAEVVLEEALLDEVARELAPVAPDFAPTSHHLQLAAGERTDPLLVLNRSYGGLAFPFSRFTHCFEEAAGEGALGTRLRDRSRRIQPSGAVFAEVTGGAVTSNLNLHERLTDYEIVCPGETGTLPEEYQLALEDLYLVHDEDDDRLVLRSRRLDCEVVPVYLGYLVPLALPEVPRTLLLLSPTSMSPLNVWGGVPESEPHAGVTRRPRVRHANLVLSRQSWSAPAAVLPLRGPGTAEDEWFLGWQRWRREHGVPEQVFATVSDSGVRGATGAKPSHLDFASPLSLAAFEALLKNPQARVVLREMLPGPGELHTVSGRGTHVAELAVETLFSQPAAADTQDATHGATHGATDDATHDRSEAR